MDLKTPDRVPVMCQLSIGHMLLQLGVSPVEFWHDAGVFADGLVKLREIYDFDGILVSLHGHDREWRSRIRRRGVENSCEEVLWDNGDWLRYVPDDLPQPLNTELPPVSLAALSVRDLPVRLDYIPVSKGLRFRIDTDNKFEVFRLVRSRIGDQYSLHGEITSPLDYFLDLLGYQEGLFSLLIEPEKSKLVLAHFTELVEALALEMCDQGVDAIKVSSPFAGGRFMSTDSYREFVLPFEGRIARSVRGKGIHIYTHTCGAVSDRLEMMFDAGVSGIECLDPPPLGDVDLSDAKKRTAGRGFIKGNVDSVNTLLFSEAGSILDDARRRIETGREGGGFILSTACSVAPRVPREKLQLLRQAVERWG